MHYPVAVPTPITRREVARFLGRFVLYGLVCLFAPFGICCWLLRLIWQAPLTRWVRYQIKRTGQDLYADR